MPDAEVGTYCRNNRRCTMWAKLILSAVVPALIVIASVTRADECPTIPNLPSSDGSQPANLGVLKLQLLDYKCFGAYDRDVANVLAEARTYLEYRANGFGKLALVLDIDETSLSNLPNLLANDFGFFRGGARLRPHRALVQGRQPHVFRRLHGDASRLIDNAIPILDLYAAAGFAAAR